MTTEAPPGDRTNRGPGLALVGYRGTGKTTVGKILAKRLDRPFLDADLEIEVRAGCSIPSIFAEWGEPTFREWEERTLRELVRDHPGAVLATGGGAVIRQASRDLLRAFGQVVWLQAGPDELARRLNADYQQGVERPALTSVGTIAEIASVLEARRALYREIADVAVETSGRTPGEIAELILGSWQV
jgi:shikimate kinase